MRMGAVVQRPYICIMQYDALDKCNDPAVGAPYHRAPFPLDLYHIYLDYSLDLVSQYTIIMI